MRYATRLAVIAFLLSTLPSSAGQELREVVLRKSALKSGLIPAVETRVAVDAQMVTAGRLLFQSRSLSLDKQIACASCHVDRFGSADGLPNAFGTEASGQGLARMIGGGDIIPRNTLAFWGRGGKQFNIFFWDGKVDASSGTLHSQFAGKEPSDDALVVAVHLPPVEIGEMVMDSPANNALETESVSTAKQVYAILIERIRAMPELSGPLAQAAGKPVRALTFSDIAEAIASFIRENFAVRSTRFHDFVFNDGELSAQELAGGLLFYGKAGCSGCHNGPYFSDMDFHAIPFPQVGFGKNGFGVDYGRFNVTMDPDDRYKFRTPPLYNVTKTAPYSHSGSLYKLGDAIRAHVDPLALYDPGSMTDIERTEFYARLKTWSGEPINALHLAEDEVAALEAFLATLEYDSLLSTIETD
ncbi:cytochrome c peroxidase [Breoghania corrubedonensis]|uniref:Cytochrome c peroxidase n=1 Tax=Breoghania corrubedonensis TaxID=665038 RepID=A0A2T5VA04_9HYPH|nr:His-Xaa-Ser system-associated MauG-like protein [Breoghania corrubedonensis]PTW60585.1 cytochrome c peroxidase [Breoghania corrubedonensis]